MTGFSGPIYVLQEEVVEYMTDYGCNPLTVLVYYYIRVSSNDAHTCTTLFSLHVDRGGMDAM